MVSDGSPTWKPDCASGRRFRGTLHLLVRYSSLFFSCSRAGEQCIAGASTHQHTQPAHRETTMDPANSNSRSPQDDVSADRKKWPDYCRRAFTSFRDKIYSAMSRSTVHRYAAHMQDMFQLTRVHRCSRGTCKMSGTRSSFTSSATATNLFRLRWLISGAMLPRAEAQRQHRGSDMARSWPELGVPARPGPSLGAGSPCRLQAFQIFQVVCLQLQTLHLPGNSTASDAEPASSRQQTASEHMLRSQSHTKTSWLS